MTARAVLAVAHSSMNFAKRRITHFGCRNGKTLSRITQRISSAGGCFIAKQKWNWKKFGTAMKKPASQSQFHSLGHLQRTGSTKQVFVRWISSAMSQRPRRLTYSTTRRMENQSDWLKQ